MEINIPPYDRYHKVWLYSYCRECGQIPRGDVYFCACHGEAHLCAECYMVGELGEHEHCEIDHAEPIEFAQSETWARSIPPMPEMFQVPKDFVYRVIVMTSQEGTDITIGHAFIADGRLYSALHTLKDANGLIVKEIAVFKLIDGNEPVGMWMQRPCVDMKLTDMRQDDETDLVSWHVASGAPEEQVQMRESRPEEGTRAFVCAATGVLTCTVLESPLGNTMVCSFDHSEPLRMGSGSPVVDEQGRVFAVYTTGSKIGDESQPDRFLIGGPFLI